MREKLLDSLHYYILEKCFEIRRLYYFAKFSGQIAVSIALVSSKRASRRSDGQCVIHRVLGNAAAAVAAAACGPSTHDCAAPARPVPAHAHYPLLSVVFKQAVHR